LTEVAWSLGKIQDKRSIQPLYNLHKKLQAILDPDNADQGRNELAFTPVERIEEAL
jgi:HEAT repeat protein